MIENETSLRRLWRQVFHDDEAFLNLFFSEKGSLLEPLAVEKDGEVLAALYQLPYSFSLGCEALQTRYTYAAATLPEARGQGHMSGLIVRSFAAALAGGSVLSVLVPAEESLWDYYGRFGYGPAFERSIAAFSSEDPSLQGAESALWFSKNPVDLLQSYELLRRETPNLLEQDAAAFSFALQMQGCFGGEGVAFMQGNRAVGHMLYTMTPQNLTAEEFYCEKALLSQALGALKRQFHDCKAFQLSGPPCLFSDHKRFGMMRILDARRFLEAFVRAYPTHEVVIELRDRLLPQNQKRFQLRGDCVFETEDAPAEELDIALLPAFLFSVLEQTAPYMNDMLQ